MSHKCKYCNKEFSKNDEIILEGKYPGVGQKLFRKMLYLDLEEFVDAFHRECFFKEMKSRTDDKTLQELILKMENKRSKRR